MHRKFILFFVVSCLFFIVSCAQPQYAPYSYGPTTAQEYFDSGMRAFGQEQYQIALSSFEQAAMMSPGFAEAHYYAGLSAWKLNMIEKAKKSFSDALNMKPNHIKAREALGLLLCDSREFNEARRQLETARNLNSINPEVYLCLGRIYMMERRCPEALMAFGQGLQMDSSSLPLGNEYEAARRVCGGGVSGPVIKEKTFRGAGKAIDPSDF